MTAARTAMPVDRVLTALGETPSRIAEAVGGAAARRLRTKPAPGEWSAAEVLAHLRACADVWGGCIDIILRDDEPTIRAVSPRRWGATGDYAAEPFADSLRAFTAQRADLLAVLESLRPDDWARRATITGTGKPLVRSVYDYAAWLARHERPHVRQIQRTIAASVSSDRRRTRPTQATSSR